MHFASDMSRLEQAKSDLRLVFKNQNEVRTFWDYRALAVVNQKLGNSERAKKAIADAFALGGTAPPRIAEALANNRRTLGKRRHRKAPG